MFVFVSLVKKIIMFFNCNFEFWFVLKIAQYELFENMIVKCLFCVLLSIGHMPLNNHFVFQSNKPCYEHV